MRRGRRPAEALRRAIDCLPEATRRAMLEGVSSDRIIVGAYTDSRGGTCPMLSAHRRGGRTSLASFARAWDRYTRAKGRPRPASERELRTLRTMLEASLAADAGGGTGEFAAVIAEHRAATARRAEAPADRRPDTGERDRSSELRTRPGWAWLRVFRRHDEFQAALEEVGEAERAASSTGGVQDTREPAAAGDRS